MGIGDILILTLLNVIWGTAFAASGYAMKFISPVFLFAIRFLFTGLITVPIYRIAWDKISKKLVKNIFILATLQTITFYGVALSVKNLDSSTTAILTRLDIPFTIILASITFKEKIKIQTIIGVFICFHGIYILSGAIQFTNIKYIFLMIFASLTSGLANIIVKQLKDVDNRVVVAWNSVIMGIEMLIIAYFTENQFILLQPLNMKFVLCLAYLCLLSNYIAYIILYYLLKKYDTTKLMPYNFFRPIISIISGYIILQEPITYNKIIGTIMLLLGVFMTEHEYNKRSVISVMYRKAKIFVKRKRRVYYRIEQ